MPDPNPGRLLRWLCLQLGYGRWPLVMLLLQQLLPLPLLRVLLLLLLPSLGLLPLVIWIVSISVVVAVSWVTRACTVVGS